MTPPFRHGPTRAAGIVLCGGRSSRMGRPKALLPWRGQPMVAHVVAALRRVVDEIVVVSSAALELPPLDATVVHDRDPELGPLAGIREGLAAVSAELAYVTATDAPFLTPDFIEALLAHGCAAAPEVDGHVQTLAAVYPRAGHAEASALIDAGRMRPLHLLEALDYRKIPPSELPNVDSVRGFNTPPEYLSAVREAEPNATAMLELRGSVGLASDSGALEVPVGTLAEVLAHAPPGLELLQGDDVAVHFRVRLDGSAIVLEGGVPIGPDERVIVEAATADPDA